MENTQNETQSNSQVQDVIDELLKPVIDLDNLPTHELTVNTEGVGDDSLIVVETDVVGKILESFDSMDDAPTTAVAKSVPSAQSDMSRDDTSEDMQFILNTSESDYYLIVNEYHKLGITTDQDFLLMLINERTHTPTYQKWIRENMPTEYKEAETAHTEGGTKEAQKANAATNLGTKEPESPKSEPKKESEANYTPPPTPKQEAFKIDLSKVNWWVVGGVIAVIAILWYAYKKLSSVSIAAPNNNGGNKAVNTTQATVSKAMSKIGLNTDGLGI